MKKLLIILLCLPMIGFGQQTYVPDDVFEDYIETTFPAADNGIANDDYVLTAGLVLTSMPLGITLDPTTLSSPIISDFTGIEDFVDLHLITISNLNNTTIDLSQATLTALYNFCAAEINIGSCPLLTDIILPPDTIQLVLNANTYLTNIVFQPLTFIGNDIGLFGLQIHGCNSLLTIDISNIAGVFNDSYLDVSGNINLTQLNIKNGFCYNWGTVNISNNANLFCVQVDDPNYSSISANWTWYEFNWGNQNNQYSYSTNCGWPSVIDEHSTSKELLRTIDLLGRETTNNPLFYIYDDETVEKRMVIE
ncbi:MAG: hypothetical protein VYD71_03970 [Bacteroidota bacterium]|nr:hypothetical protein [Bacteroidota bacterium]